MSSPSDLSTLYAALGGGGGGDAQVLGGGEAQVLGVGDKVASAFPNTSHTSRGLPRTFVPHGTLTLCRQRSLEFNTRVHYGLSLFRERIPAEISCRLGY